MTFKQDNSWGNNPKTLIIFYSLSFYILLQFSWWAYLLYDLTKEIYELKAIEGGEQNLFTQSFNEKKWMILGEGMVFLFLLVLGAFFLLRSFKKEVKMAHQQQNFQLSITHELKTPIAAVKLYLQTLLKRELNKEQQVDILQKTLKENDRLQGLVEKILLATKVDDGSFYLQKEKVNIHSVLLEILEKNEAAKFDLSVSEGIYIQTDKNALESVLTNLIDNAIKYTEGQAEIAISVEKNDQTINISVADKGIGISDEEKERVFSRFYRSENENTRNTKGTGLGLYIVKTLVEMLKGEIKIQDNNPKGTIFKIQLRSR